MMKKADKLFKKEHILYRSSSVKEETRHSYMVKALTDLIFYWARAAVGEAGLTVNQVLRLSRFESYRAHKLSSCSSVGQ